MPLGLYSFKSDIYYFKFMKTLLGLVLFACSFSFAQNTMKQDIIDVIRKYVAIGSDDVNVNLDNKSDSLSVLELNITLPDKADD